MEKEKADQPKVPVLEWLRKNNKRLNISQIKRETGVTNLKNIINNTPDGRGYLPHLTEKNIICLDNFVKDMEYKKDITSPTET